MKNERRRGGEKVDYHTHTYHHADTLRQQCRVKREEQEEKR